MHESKEKMRTIKIKTPRKGEHMTIYTHRQTRMPTRKTRTQGDLFFFYPRKPGRKITGLL